MSDAVLKVRDLCVDFSTEEGNVRAVDHLNFDLMPGETLGLVGESGCGKSISSLAILGLVPQPPGRVTSAGIELDGNPIHGLPEKQLRSLRGSKISMIFQEPMTALNPVFSIASQMTDVLRRHQGMSRKQARQHAIGMLDKVGIADAPSRIDDYPHELSGGMRQRVMIAMALSCNPRVLIADEPTTALDVTTQAQVLEQIQTLQQETGTAVIFITHDLGVIAEVCSRAMVMYCGTVVEQSPVEDLFNRPRHPYTWGLMNAIPSVRADNPEYLPTIPGSVPDLLHLPAGCRFADRCKFAKPVCSQTRPTLSSGHYEHGYACHVPLEWQPA
jgi:oligopeptide/dipeptide ABC transporter ATP-binding protein